MRILSSVIFLTLTLPALAHHSRSHYTGDVREVEGELVAVHWVNPHVGFTVSVINEQGQAELWRVEGVSNLVGMQRGGVTRDDFTIGEQVTAVGSPSVRRPRDLLTTNLLLANGTEVVLDRNAAPYWSEQAIGPYDPRLTESVVVDAATENRGIFRVWTGPVNAIGQRSDFSFTESAIAARAEWNPLDNFAERCEPEGMPRIMRNPHPFAFVDQGTEYELISELYDLARTIRMDGSAAAVDEPLSPLGYSTGHWEDTTLVVLTTHINWPYFDNIGTPQTEALEIVERFTISEDQTRLDYQFTAADPATFLRPAVYERYWLALGDHIEDYDCQVY